MKKRFFIGIGLMIILCVIFGGGLFFIKTNRQSVQTLVYYNGNRLRISVDGEAISTLPTSGNYYLVDYSCKSKDTVLEWNRESYQLKVSNGTKKGGVSCYLEFESTPKLSRMPVGNYVAYIGSGGTVGSTSVACQSNGSASSSTATAETEAPNSCNGQNAREDLDASGYTYGYCYSSSYKYYTTGWRIAYTLNGKVTLVSAGSPECDGRTSSTGNVTYIQEANAKALKYCNTDYVDGNCSCISTTSGLCSAASSDAWAINDTDFYYMTKAISGVGKRLTSGSSSLGDSGGTLGSVLYCDSKYSYQECGYNNDLIDNGGYYWFAARYSSSETYGVFWYPGNRRVNYITGAHAYGMRPVISLSSSVIVIDGDGTMDNPYEIANNTFFIDEASMVSDENSNSINLKMLGYNVNKMCINLNSSGCSNYVDFSENYTLDLTNANDGENIIYVYYKDSNGKIVASMNKSITLGS